MKLKRILTMGLAAVITITAVSIPAFADDSGDEVVYSYDDCGTTVNITQADLDAGHWDKEALGDNAPILYDKFPMSVEAFTTDFGDVYFDIEYMKKLDDFTSVHLDISDIRGRNILYSEDLNIGSFYSPQVSVGTDYIIRLTENLNGETTEYERIARVNAQETEMPDYIANSEGDEEILIAAIEDIEAVEQLSDIGSIVIDNRTNPYVTVTADDFDDYCGELNTNTTYRIATVSNGERYVGFFNGNNNQYIYNYYVSLDDGLTAMETGLNTVGIQSTPSSVLLNDVKTKAIDMGFEDYTQRVKDGSSNTSKFAAFRVNISDNPLANITSSSSCGIKTILRGDAPIGIYMWVIVDGTAYPVNVAATNGSTTRTININLKSNTYGITASSDVDIYAAVYFPTVTLGYAMASFEMTGDNVDAENGSMYAALNDLTLPAEKPNFDYYTMTGAQDVDVFFLKSLANLYKVTVRNRNYTQQQAIDAGQYANGSKEKYAYFYTARYSTNSSATNPTNVLVYYDGATYTIPKNADVTMYAEGSTSSSYSFVLIRQASNTTSVNDYQLAYQMWGDDGSVTEE